MNFKKKVGGSWTDIPHYIMGTSTDTITSLPAVIYANDTTATVGLKGNMSQSGTPTPDNPVMPQGTGERTGNLWAGDVPRYSYSKDYKKYNPDNAVYIKAGTYTISSDRKLPNFQAFDDNHTQYSISEIMTFPSAYYSVWNGLSISPISATIHTATITILADCIITLTVVDDLGTYIMLNSGSTALPYEPYGYKIPISSASTTTPVYLGEVESTRKIKKLVLTGGANEDLRKNNQDPSNYLYYLRLTVDNIGARDCLCTHLMWGTGAPTDSIGCNANLPRIIYMNFGADIMDAQTSGNTVAGLKEYLAAQYAAGTPVTVWYVLATEETAVVNEPLMKIGEYADTVSGVSIPTTTGKDTFDVLTTLKPSEVELTYTGWHDATAKEWDGSDWQ